MMRACTKNKEREKVGIGRLVHWVVGREREGRRKIPFSFISNPISNMNQTKFE